MRLTQVWLEEQAGWVRLVGRIERTSGEVQELYYRFPASHADLVLESADPFLPALLPPCMMGGEPLELGPPVDPVLLRSASTAQELLAGWNPGFAQVTLSARPREGSQELSAGATASLFSGGVDSFYTLMKARQAGAPVDHVLFMGGLEQPMERSRGTRESFDLAAAAAGRFGAQAIYGETNLRSLFPRVNYERTYQSAALSSAALVLSRGLRRLYIPSSASFSQLEPWGSHPMLDGLWSTRRLEVVHHGAEARRIDKLELLATDPQVLATLRVCLQNGSGPTNCGRCMKCARTMAGLLVLGALPKAKLFPAQPPKDFARLLAMDHDEMLDEILDFAATHPCAPEVVRVLERARRLRTRGRALRDLARNTPGVAEAYAFVRRLRDQWLAPRAPEPPPLAPATVKVSDV